jgi:hypothetical protein
VRYAKETLGNKNTTIMTNKLKELGMIDINREENVTIKSKYNALAFQEKMPRYDNRIDYNKSFMKQALDIIVATEKNIKDIKLVKSKT